MKVLVHGFIFVFLTVVTQIGGVIYLLVLFLLRKDVEWRRSKRLGLFLLLYALATFVVVPRLAPVFGREKLRETAFLHSQSFLYKLANRNYVRPELNRSMAEIAEAFAQRNPGMRVHYLDANFPFIDGFPLLPHLSHKDGKKIDVCLVYEKPDGTLTNQKPSVSGYGVYEGPARGEYDQNRACKEAGNPFYDFPKYLTFGRLNRHLDFSEKGTKSLVQSILAQKNIGKLFIEPHLKKRLHLRDGRVRFHGCWAVRHDDHIHFQLR